MKILVTEEQVGLIFEYFKKENPFASFIRTQLEKVIKEAKNIQGCGVFDNKNQKEFCKASESIISESLDEYSNPMETLLKTYFLSDEKISSIIMEKLGEESPIVSNGFEEIEKVVDLLKPNCPQAGKVSENLKSSWMKKYSVYFKDNGGKYHLLNRLNTNYTAMAILVTIYYENQINQVREWSSSKNLPAKEYAKNWIDHFFYPNIKLIDPRKNWEKDVLKVSKPLESLPSKVQVFNDLFSEGDIAVTESEYQKKFMKALEEVRAAGFKTEEIFENMLKKYDIEYIPFNYDYSFVDMILGIDFLIKTKRKGEVFWVPVQVKTTFRKIDTLIDKLKCIKVIKPELINVDGKSDFRIGDIRGFEEYFCNEHHYCKSNKKYSPSHYDYLSSKEFLEK